MKLWSFSFIFFAIITGCRPVSVSDDAVISVTNTPAIASVDDRIRFSVEGFDISFNYPAQWEYYATEFGVVVAESLNTVADDGRLDGLLVHVWVPPLADFSIPTTLNNNRAAYILEQIVRNPVYIGSAQVTPPQSFDWDGVQAAYYLLDNSEGNVTVVIGLVLPEDTRLIAVSVSAPSQQLARVREETPRLLDALRINGLTLSGASLELTLPHNLQIIPALRPRGASLPVMPAFGTFAGLFPASGD